MRFIEDLEVKTNVRLVTRERGKIRDIRESHNIFTNIGRDYVTNFMGGAAVAAPAVTDTVEYVGVGIGSDEQTIDIGTVYPSLDSSYPGLNVFSDDVPTLTTLERPVQITTGVWMASGVLSKPTTTTLRITYLFGVGDINLGGTYPIVPISETGLYLSTENPSAAPYSSLTPFISGARTSEQRVIAYNGFAPVSKSSSMSLEIRWELRL